MSELTVRLRQGHARQWVVTLEKTGARLEVYRGAPGNRHPAHGYAVALAAFLGAALVEHEEDK